MNAIQIDEYIKYMEGIGVTKFTMLPADPVFSNDFLVNPIIYATVFFASLILWHFILTRKSVRSKKILLISIDYIWLTTAVISALLALFTYNYDKLEKSFKSHKQHIHMIAEHALGVSHLMGTLCLTTNYLQWLQEEVDGNTHPDEQKNIENLLSTQIDMCKFLPESNDMVYQFYFVADGGRDVPSIEAGLLNAFKEILEDAKINNVCKDNFKEIYTTELNNSSLDQVRTLQHYICEDLSLLRMKVPEASFIAVNLDRLTKYKNLATGWPYLLLFFASLRLSKITINILDSKKHNDA